MGAFSPLNFHVSTAVTVAIAVLFLLLLLFLSVRSPFSISFFLAVSFSLADCPVTEYSGCPSKRRGFVIENESENDDERREVKLS